MPVFTVLDPYSEDGGACRGQSANNATQPDSDEFEIDSDVSDEDLLLLRAELERAKTTKTQRDLAAATLAEQKLYLRRWER